MKGWSDALQVGLAIGLITAWQNRALTNAMIGKEAAARAKRMRKLMRYGVRPPAPPRPKRVRQARRKRSTPHEPTQAPEVRKKQPPIFR